MSTTDCVSLFVLYWPLFLTCILCAMAARKDALTFTIPNYYPLSICFLWICMQVQLFFATASLDSSHIWESVYSFFTTNTSILGVTALDGVGVAAVILVLMLLVSVLYEKATGKYSMGGGDIKLIASLALYIGFDGTVFGGAAIFIVLACIIYICQICLGKKSSNSPKDARAFGPAIATGFIAYVCLVFVVACV